MHGAWGTHRRSDMTSIQHITRHLVANASSPASQRPSKAATVRKLLSRAKGASIAELRQSTGWQPHSIRAYLSGLRKKGFVLVREQHGESGTLYRIEDAAAESSTDATAQAD